MVNRWGSSTIYLILVEQNASDPFIKSPEADGDIDFDLSTLDCMDEATYIETSTYFKFSYRQKLFRDIFIKK